MDQLLALFGASEENMRGVVINHAKHGRVPAREVVRERVIRKVKEVLKTSTVEEEEEEEGDKSVDEDLARTLSSVSPFLWKTNRIEKFYIPNLFSSTPPATPVQKSPPIQTKPCTSFSQSGITIPLIIGQSPEDQPEAHSAERESVTRKLQPAFPFSASQPASRALGPGIAQQEALKQDAELYSIEKGREGPRTPTKIGKDKMVRASTEVHQQEVMVPSDSNLLGSS